MNASDPRWRRWAAGGLGRLDTALGRGIEALADTRRIAAFLRGRLEFRPRPDDVYVVTYPRSGTTWMQLMLHLLLHDGDLSFSHIGEVCPWFERSLAIGHRRAADFEQCPTPRVFKSHLPWGWLPRPGRYIYIVRDAADVALSYYHFYRSHLGFTGEFAEFFERLVQGQLQYGSWHAHVQGWHIHRDEPGVLWLHYEAMRRDPMDALRQVATLCEHAISEARLAQVVAASSIEIMRKHDHKFDHATAVLIERGMQRGGFIRQGKVGQGTAMLTEAQRQMLARIEHSGSPTKVNPWNLGPFLH